MKLTKLFLFLIFGLLNSSFSYSREESSFIKDSLKSDNVSSCNVEKIKVNFCTNEKIKIYNQKMASTANFSNDKILIILNEDRYTGKGDSRNVKAIVVIDSSKGKIYPLQQIVGNFVDSRLEVLINENPEIKFSKSSNEVCISGTTYASDDNNINVENECYIFKNDSFKKIKTDPEIIGSEKNTVSKKYDSDVHLKCISKKTKECSGLNLIETKELFKKYDFVNLSDGPSMVLDRGRFQLIISPFEDESGPNLRVMQVKNNKLVDEKFIYLNNRVEIDNNSIMTYYQNSKKIIYQFK